MSDVCFMLILALGCYLLFHICNRLAACVPYDPIHDFNGYRRNSLTREDLHELNRLCIGKSRKEQRWIVHNYHGKV